MGNFQGFEIHSQRLLNTNGSTFAPHECSSFSPVSVAYIHAHNHWPGGLIPFDFHAPLMLSRPRSRHYTSTRILVRITAFSIGPWVAARRTASPCPAT